MSPSIRFLFKEFLLGKKVLIRELSSRTKFQFFGIFPNWKKIEISFQAILESQTESPIQEFKKTFFRIALPFEKKFGSSPSIL